MQESVSAWIIVSDANKSDRQIKPRFPEWPKQLDLRAAVHHNLQAGRLGQPRGLIIANADLHPDHLGADPYGLLGDRHRPLPRYGISPPYPPVGRSR